MHIEIRRTLFSASETRYGLLDRILPIPRSSDSHSQTHQMGDYAVIATGISGAGKTTVMRHVLKRILGLENQEQDQARDGHTIITDKSTETINDNLEATLVIVDAMGNAQTRNNTDPSRMVKVIQVSRTYTGSCCLSLPDLCSS